MDKTKETISYLWRHAWRYKPLVIGILVTTPLAIFFHTFLSTLIISDILQRLSERTYQPEEFFGVFGPSLLLFIGIYLIGNVILYRILTFLLWRLDNQVSRDIAEEIFNHLMHLDVAFHANRFGGALVAQAGRLTSSFERVLYITIYTAAPLLLTFIFTSIVLLPRVPGYVAILLVLACLYLFIALHSARRIRHLNTTEAEANSRQTGILADGITNIMTVKSFGREKNENRTFKKATAASLKASDALLKATLKRDTYFSLTGSAFNIGAVTTATASVVFFGADIATAFLMLTYSLAIARSLWDFSSRALREYNRALGEAREMIAVLHQLPAISDPKKPILLQAGNSSITFHHIEFTHEEAAQPLFKDFNLHIKAGEKVGLVGHSGSGKTTLTKLLLRFADPASGHILINNQRIIETTQTNLRESIAYVPQEPLLFHRSIKENIAYGRPGATNQEIVEAAKKAHALEFIDALPNKFDTLVGERGVKLSGGQRQRIAIARAILKNAPILILDEATSALDSESEKAIQKALQKLMKGRTVLVVAHRLSTIASLDRIVVLDKGEIIEEGGHSALLAKNGTYAKLWHHQSSGFIEE